MGNLKVCRSSEEGSGLKLSHAGYQAHLICGYHALEGHGLPAAFAMAAYVPSDTVQLECVIGDQVTTAHDSPQTQPRPTFISIIPASGTRPSCISNQRHDTRRCHSLHPLSCTLYQPIWSISSTQVIRLGEDLRCS